MSNCYGILNSNRDNKMTKCGDSFIEARVQTWTGHVTVSLTKENEATIDFENVNLIVMGKRCFTKEPELNFMRIELQLKKLWKQEHKTLVSFPRKEWRQILEKSRRLELLERA